MKKQTQKIRILLADDQQLFSDNLKLMLETLAEDICVTGIASNGQEVIEMAEVHKPDIILMDVRMPVIDGVKATHILHQKHPEIKIVMLSTFPDDSYVQDALHYGAYGYILKNMKSEDLIASIRTISSGVALLSPAVLEKLIHKENTDTGEDDISDEYREVLSRLKKREREILQLIAQGYTNQKIADTLYISEPTVRNYISSIYAKVGTKDRLTVMSIGKKKNAGKE